MSWGGGGGDPTVLQLELCIHESYKAQIIASGKIICKIQKRVILSLKVIGLWRARPLIFTLICSGPPFYLFTYDE